MRPKVVTLLFALAISTICIPSVAQEATMNAKESESRYEENPIALLFESYVLDVIGYLPEGRSDKIQSMNLQKVFKTSSTQWKDVIRETLHLSNTIDIAILDLWYTNQDLAAERHVDYSPVQFAQDFADEYTKDGSKIDIWPPGALASAQARIAARKRPNN